MPVAIVPQIVRDQYGRADGFTDFPASVGAIPPMPANGRYPVAVEWNLALNETELAKRQGLARGASEAIAQAIVTSNLGPVVAPNSMARFGEPEQFWLRWGIAGPTASKFFTRLHKGDAIFQADDFPAAAPPPNPVLPPANNMPTLADFRQTALAEIADMDAKYARPGVPDHFVIVYNNLTLAGIKWSRKVKANKDARFTGLAGAVFPEAVPAEAYTSFFPPPEGSIMPGYFPITTIFFDPRNNYTDPAGPFPVGAYSEYVPPLNSWRNGEPVPAPFRYPNPRLYFGLRPGFVGLDPESGNDVDVPGTKDDPPPPPVTNVGVPNPNEPPGSVIADPFPGNAGPVPNTTPVGPSSLPGPAGSEPPSGLNPPATPAGAATTPVGGGVAMPTTKTLLFVLLGAFVLWGISRQGAE